MSLNLQTLFKNLVAFTFLATLSGNVLAEQGLFWKVESPAGKTSYLFGTIHTDDNRVTDFSPAVNNALQSVDAFMMETLAPNDPSVFMMPDGDLKTILTEKELDKVYQLAEFHTMHRDAATHMKPWLLAVVFDSPKPLTPFAQDNLLMSKSEDLGKEVIGIEDTQEHFGVMDNFSRDEQLIMLRAVLKRSQAQKERDFESQNMRFQVAPPTAWCFRIWKEKDFHLCIAGWRSGHCPIPPPVWTLAWPCWRC